MHIADFTEIRCLHVCSNYRAVQLHLFFDHLRRNRGRPSANRRVQSLDCAKISVIRKMGLAVGMLCERFEWCDVTWAHQWPQHGDGYINDMGTSMASAWTVCIVCFCQTCTLKPESPLAHSEERAFLDPPQLKALGRISRLVRSERWQMSVRVQASLRVCASMCMCVCKYKGVHMMHVSPE